MERVLYQPWRTHPTTSGMWLRFWRRPHRVVAEHDDNPHLFETPSIPNKHPTCERFRTRTLDHASIANHPVREECVGVV